MDNQKPFHIIVAVTPSGVMGLENFNETPWQHAGVRLQGDLPRFKRMTIGSPAEGRKNAVICGRRTAESMGNFFPLENRKNFVLSASGNYAAPEDVVVCASLDEAVKMCNDDSEIEEIWDIGGHKPYADGLRIADTVIMTVTHEEFPGEIYFPQYPLRPEIWKQTDNQCYSKDKYNVYTYVRLR